MFLDVTDMIDYNVALLSHHDLQHSFFCLDREDPTKGFEFDATRYCGPTYPPSPDATGVDLSDPLSRRLILGSHLAFHMRMRLDAERGYTATVGVSTNKLLAKLVGSVNKPNNQTTLIPPYSVDRDDEGCSSNVTKLMDSHELGKVPGIGFKTAQKLRTHVLGREPTFQPYVERSQDAQVTVRDVRQFPGMGPAMLTSILVGPGTAKDIGVRVWELLHGVDNSEVLEARTIPTQISIEDSYKGLPHNDAVRRELCHLAASLIRRMRADLTKMDETGSGRLRWLARPRTVRLSTRLRSPKMPDGSRNYSFMNQRVSRSGPAPSFIFSLDDDIDALATRLVDELLLSMFRRSFPARSLEELALINVAVTNMTDAEPKQNRGQDISKMFRQEEMPSTTPTSAVVDAEVFWEESDGEDGTYHHELCPRCGVPVPYFALAAHAQYHAAPD